MRTLLTAYELVLLYPLIMVPTRDSRLIQCCTTVDENIELARRKAELGVYNTELTQGTPLGAYYANANRQTDKLPERCDAQEDIRSRSTSAHFPIDRNAMTQNIFGRYGATSLPVTSVLRGRRCAMHSAHGLRSRVLGHGGKCSL